MNTLRFIKEHGLKALTEQLAIKIKTYEEFGIVVLNYCQIDSPKQHPVVLECRGLILDSKNWSVLARPFNRFFNAGECPDLLEDFDINRAVAHEKVDGSLIKVWNWGGTWHCGTRGTAFAETEVNGFDLTFAELVYDALGCDNHKEFDQLCGDHLSGNKTYLFEVTSAENRVVTRYDGRKLWFLGARCTRTGEDHSGMERTWLESTRFPCEFPKQSFFKSVEECIAAGRELTDLKEGYVLFDEKTHARQKVKNPAYVAVHHLRGEGLNPKRIKQLVLLNEQAEYLKYFPEDVGFITPVEEQLVEFERGVGWVWFKLSNDWRGCSQRTFASLVQKHSFSHLFFTAKKKGLHPWEVFATLDDNKRLKTFNAYLGE